ncbi:hypothetical protein N473_26685 [Pseudoalteromonas luteoviolacea CPMOR-1]|uniref:Uncharacterized protein n=1 Tax=Pseudoalteromonas luteoviolacea CPMOR-1 TaxID=1365248 RepID=A0A167H9N8_9GAMM|nr:hypothetical protein [Pseudoalteromonas luteoviolacea]KZN57792.1 hypothetical protein N473_26685 [Pseudoalteromonas luteoviolacea CPMOR-1]
MQFNAALYFCEARLVKHYFTYITKEGNYELLKVVLAKAFSTEFVDHESGWWGEYALSKNECKIKLYPNFVSGEGYHHEGKPNFPYLLEIPEQREPQRVIELMRKLPIKFELLEHDEI